MNTKTRVDWKLQLGNLFRYAPELKAPQYQGLLKGALGDRSVGLSSIQKELITLRKNYRKLHEAGELDTEWHLGTLSNPEYYLPPEAVAKIIEFKVKARGAGEDYITIRVARWMSRLSALPLSVSNLWYFAMNYAIQEELQDLIGDEYAFTSENDEHLLTMLKEKPSELLKEDFTPIPDAEQASLDLFGSITPELIKEVTGKINKHQRMVRHERSHSRTG
jgi:hypothetical protein